MSSFADPEQAVPFTLPDFPPPERPHLDFTALDAAKGSFTDFQHSQNQPEESLLVVRPALFQDFKEILNSSQP